MISINWSTKVIYIPQSYLTLVSGIKYGLNIETFRNDLKNIEDSEEGMAFPNTHTRNAPTTLSGTVYAQTFEILSPYTVTFENTGTPYVVIPSGANHNLGDVTNYDGGMSLVIGNSAGLQVYTSTGGVGTVDEVANAVWNASTASYNTVGSTGKLLKDVGSDTVIIKNQTDTLEANQQLVLDAIGNIAIASSAIHAPANAFQLVSGIVNAGTYLDTRTLDVGQHVIFDDATQFDINYTFDIGLNSVPAEFTFVGAVNDQHETVSVAAWNFTIGAWEKIGEIFGKQSSTVYDTYKFILYPDYTSKTISGQIGDVKIRFYMTALSDIHMHIDQLYVSYANVLPPTGFSGHAVSATSTTVEIGLGAVTIDNYYVPSLLTVNHGTGAMQYAKVIGYTGSTKTLLLDAPMAVTLDTTSHISLSPWGNTAVDTNAVATAIWNTPVSTLTNKTTIGGYISKVLLSLPKFLGLK